ncbi:MAG TPA: FAD-binding oxidoreductase [Terriglobales bacterium]|nr:FAD-binding oxidoreductase [Terriglobales bacterium]
MPADYIDTYYKRHLTNDECYPALQSDHQTDICIIGGGLAGLTTALELCRRGRMVTVLEAKRVAWGASGRNGGFVSPGYACDLEKISRKAGADQGKQLYRLSMEGVDIVANNIRDLAIHDAERSDGIIGAIRYDDAIGLAAYRDKMDRDFGQHLVLMQRTELRSVLRSAKYHQALFAPDAFHFHPLNYARALVREIRRLGGHIYEDSPAVSITRSNGRQDVTTPGGTIHCQEIVLAGGGYTDRLCPALTRSFLPIATYVLLTEANAALVQAAINTTAAIGDDRRAGDYYRIVRGDRILWGGRITTRTADPQNLAQLLRREMVTTYPQLSPLKVELAWSGLMSYARHLMPQIGRLTPGIWYCTAFGGHGMNTTAIGGKVIAEAITGASDRYRLFAPFALDWNGGIFGKAAAQLTYWTYQLQDAWRERRAQESA